MSTSSPGDLQAVLSTALQRLPAVLADETARRGLLAVGRQLPQALTGGPLGLELRLAGTPTVDFFAAATPRTPGFAALIAALRRPGWSDTTRAADLADVLERWQHNEGALPSVARYLLVEADAPGRPDDAVSVPSIFLAPRAPRDRYVPGQQPNAFHRCPDETVMAAAELSGVWPDPQTAAELAAVITATEAASPDGDLFAVGAMVSRSSGAALRVAIRRLPPDGIASVLQAAGRPRQAELLAACARTIPAARQAIAFEVGPGAEARVGLELSPPHDWKCARADGWPELLAAMVGGGYADAVRAAAVPGLLDADGEPLWGLAHVKIAADAAGMLPAAKLYVGLLHRAEAT